MSTGVRKGTFNFLRGKFDIFTLVFTGSSSPYRGGRGERE